MAKGNDEVIYWSWSADEKASYLFSSHWRSFYNPIMHQNISWVNIWTSQSNKIPILENSKLLMWAPSDNEACDLFGLPDVSDNKPINISFILIGKVIQSVNEFRWSSSVKSLFDHWNKY